jgi:hypothetical protein
MEYTIIRSNRRSLSITIDPDANLIVRAPRRMSDRTIAAFVASKGDWIEKHMEKVRKRAAKREEVPEFSEEERKALTKKARKMILEKVAYYAPIVGVTYGRIAIRKQRTVWGSCSAKGNLNFNYLLAMMPDEVVDYVVVHELCHRKEMNHSPRFWAEVEKVIPNHKALRKWLKEEGSVYLGK